MNGISRVCLTFLLPFAFLGGDACARTFRCDAEVSGVDAPQKEHKPLTTVSIFSLLAEPEKYHGMRISVVGAFRMYYDRISLYATKEYLTADEFRSSLWAELPQCLKLEDLEKMSELQGDFVRVDGVFNAKLKNHAAGTLQSVELVALWSSDNQPKRGNM